MTTSRKIKIKIDKKDLITMYNSANAVLARLGYKTDVIKLIKFLLLNEILIPFYEINKIMDGEYDTNNKILTKFYEKEYRGWENMVRTLRYIEDLLEKNEIEYSVTKLKFLKKNHDDIDIIIQKNDLHKTLKLFKKNGFKINKEKKQTNEISIVKPGIKRIDLHTKIMYQRINIIDNHNIDSNICLKITYPDKTSIEIRNYIDLTEEIKIIIFHGLLQKRINYMTYEKVPLERLSSVKKISYLSYSDIFNILYITNYSSLSLKKIKKFMIRKKLYKLLYLIDRLQKSRYDKTVLHDFFPFYFSFIDYLSITRKITNDNTIKLRIFSTLTRDILKIPISILLNKRDELIWRRNLYFSI